MLETIVRTLPYWQMEAEMSEQIQMALTWQYLLQGWIAISLLLVLSLHLTGLHHQPPPLAHDCGVFPLLFGCSTKEIKAQFSMVLPNIAPRLCSPALEL